MVKLKYSEISSFGFAQAAQKIASTPTHGEKASIIHKMMKSLTRTREQISKEYQAKLVETFGKKDEAGKVLRPEGEPNGFTPVEGKEEEFEKAQEAFGQTEVDLPCKPLTLAHLDGMKVSATDLEALKGLYAGNTDEDTEASPGVPSNVAAIR